MRALFVFGDEFHTVFVTVLIKVYPINIYSIYNVLSNGLLLYILFLVYRAIISIIMITTLFTDYLIVYQSTSFNVIMTAI